VNSKSKLNLERGLLIGVTRRRDMANTKGDTTHTPTAEELILNRDIGLRIRKARKAKGYSQEDVADMIGWSRPSYANFEAGKQPLQVSTLIVIAKVLGRGVMEFLPNEAMSTIDRLLDLLHSLPQEMQEPLLRSIKIQLELLNQQRQ
jgi:transcriptional regulator with XRE-family HTH domain